MNGLNIAPGLALPIDMVTEPIGVLANRGRGKSYATHALVEEIHDAGVPVVVLDVKGDWWGLRSSANGKSDGLPFYIFGGDHADLPLEPTAGDLLADLVVNERVSVVLDLSHMSKTKARSFTVAFAERLYHRNRDPLFVVVDEADVLIPQRATAETARLLGAMEDIAKRGRGRGIGMAVVTQRPQEVAKSVLDLMDTLILLGMTGPRSLKSISEWISTHVDEDTSATEVMSTLPSLPVGQAWVWSPMQQLLQRVKVRQIRTFDSHVTPKPGETRRSPQGRASLDLSALGEQIAATVEKAKADDPKALRARIRDLERELATERAQPTPASTIEYVEVPVLDTEIAASLYAALEPLSIELAHILGAMSALKGENSTYQPGADPRRRQEAPRRPAPTRPVASSPAPPIAQDTRPAAAAGGSALGKAERMILIALAQHGARTVTQVATLTAYSSKGGGFRNALSALRSAGRIVGTGTVEITEQGLADLGDFDPLPTGAALLDWWKAHPRIGKAEALILDALADAWPGSLTVEEIADYTGYSAAGGGFRNALSRLRTLELISGRGEIVIAEELMD